MKMWLAVVWLCVVSIVSTSKAGTDVIQVVARPSPPVIEVRDHRQYVNFDLLVKNNSPNPYRLVAIKLSVFDRQGRLELQRELNENGKPPALDLIGDRIISGGALIDIYQPFYELGSEVELGRMHMEFYFIDAAKAAPPVSMGAEHIASLDVQPRRARGVAYCLPLRGRVLVHDGHDFYSHHRRYNLAARFRDDPQSAVSPNLYAYDFMRTTSEGALYRGDPLRKESWLSYGEAVFAPAAGIVMQAVDDLPENTFDEAGNAEIPAAADSKDPMGFGNHVTVRHADGRVSWILHLKPGSVRLKVGDRVQTGDVIGKIGFTGDSLFPHLHYTVTDAAVYPSQGVPSYFRNFARFLGARRIGMKTGQVDTGDLVESTGLCRR